jgi:hypothetical protein
LKGWTVDAAEPGGVVANTHEGFSWLQGRYPQTLQGNTVAVMKRSCQRPNRLSQSIKSLTPGSLYSLRMFSGDFRDMSKRQKHALSIVLSDAELVPGKTFQHVFQNCYSHRWKQYNDRHPAWMNYHWMIFRAKATEARLQISDWSSDRERGGPVGQELMMNFVQVQPYDFD